MDLILWRRDSFWRVSDLLPKSCDKKICRRNKVYHSSHEVTFCSSSCIEFASSVPILSYSNFTDTDLKSKSRMRRVSYLNDAWLHPREIENGKLHQKEIFSQLKEEKTSSKSTRLTSTLQQQHPLLFKHPSFMFGKDIACRFRHFLLKCSHP